MVLVAVATIPIAESLAKDMHTQGKKLRTALDSSMTNIDQENIDGGLRWPNHVLSWRHKLDYRVVKLWASPAVPRLIAYLIPVKQLGHLI